MTDIYEDPVGVFVFASCDMAYLDSHAPAFIASNAIAGNSIHIHLMEQPGFRATSLSKLVALRIRYDALAKGTRMTFSIETLQVPKGVNSETLRTYYASNRFLIAPRLLSCGGTMYLSDIDSIFLNKMEKLDADVGLFLRESLPGTVGWEALGTKVAAGLVYYSGSENSRQFASKVVNNLNTNGLVWFTDQVSLHQAYTYYEKKMKFHTFDMSVMDWEFRDSSPIWTGKGTRKDLDKRYLAKKMEMESKLPSVRGAFWR